MYVYLVDKVENTVGYTVQDGVCTSTWIEQIDKYQCYTLTKSIIILGIDFDWV